MALAHRIDSLTTYQAVGILLPVLLAAGVIVGRN
jgi:hypothetical protein